MSALMRPRKSWRIPEARVVLASTAARPEWLDRRRRGIGGSDASAIVGVNRFSSRYEVWLDKTGRLPEQEPTARMKAGVLLEPVLRSWFMQETGIDVKQPGMLANETRPWQLVNLDGLTEDGGLLECKNTNGWLRNEWEDGQVPDHAEVQAQHGMAVTGLDHAYIVGLIDGWDFQLRRVDRDDQLIADITELERIFWEVNVLGDVQPPMDPPALDLLKKLHPDTDETTVAAAPPDKAAPLVEEYRASTMALRAAQRRKDTAEAELRALIGPASGLAVLGNTVATLKTITTSRLDGKRLAAEHPDLAGRYRIEGSYRRLALTKD